MPWTAADATRHTKKAKTPKAKQQWEKIADKLLESGKDEGTAIRTANGVIKKRGGK